MPNGAVGAQCPRAMKQALKGRSARQEEGDQEGGGVGSQRPAAAFHPMKGCPTAAARRQAEGSGVLHASVNVDRNC